jgi:hypothetical protein
VSKRSEGTEEMLKNMQQQVIERWRGINSYELDRWLQEKLRDELIKPISIYD